MLFKLFKHATNYTKYIYLPLEQPVNATAMKHQTVRNWCSSWFSDTLQPIVQPHVSNVLSDCTPLHDL